MAIMMPIMMFLMNGTTLMILWFGSKQVDSGMIQVGSIMAFMQYAMQVIMAFLMITMVTIMLPRANVSALRIHEVLSSEITIKIHQILWISHLLCEALYLLKMYRLNIQVPMKKC